MSTETIAPVPQKPISNGHNRNIFTLFYRYGNVPSLSENFVMPSGSTIVDAIQKGRQHCLLMNYKFLYVKPFIYDMEMAEQRKKDGKGVDDPRVFAAAT